MINSPYFCYMVSLIIAFGLMILIFQCAILWFIWIVYEKLNTSPEIIIHKVPEKEYVTTISHN